MDVNEYCHRLRCAAMKSTVDSWSGSIAKSRASPAVSCPAISCPVACGLLMLMLFLRGVRWDGMLDPLSTEKSGGVGL